MARRSRTSIMLSLALVAGCNGLFGIESGLFEPGADAGTSVDATTPDTTTTAPLADSAVDPPDAGVDTPTVDASTPEPPVPVPGPCVGIASNPRHCGVCNHDCGTGLCNALKCQPGLIVVDTTIPTSLVATGKHVIYQTAKGEVRRVSIWGGSPVTLFRATTPTGLGQNLVLRNDFVYFVDRDGQRVARCPTSGTCTPETVMGGVSNPFSLAVSGGWCS